MSALKVTSIIIGACIILAGLAGALLFIVVKDSVEEFKELQGEDIGSDGLNVPQALEDPGRTEVSELSKTA